MEKLIVIVFDDQTKAFAGLEALRELDRDGEISLFAAQIAAKEPNGGVRFIDTPDGVDFPVIGVSTLLGTLVGVLGGPIGLVGGAAAGALIGSIIELEHAGITDEFINDVAAALTPGKVAVVADIAEEWVTPLDTRMERIGGVVFRRARTLVKNLQADRDAAAHRVEMEQLKAERAQARGERLAKIDAKIDNLRARLETALERRRFKMQLRQQQREAKIRALQAKADKAEGEIRRRQEARIAELRRDYEEKPALG
ncbi:MAG: DUF1269 domain-containing protein [Bryobacteraceae bacterium]|jgi:uncharacterized membrane protein